MRMLLADARVPACRALIRIGGAKQQRFRERPANELNAQGMPFEVKPAGTLTAGSPR